MHQIKRLQYQCTRSGHTPPGLNSRRSSTEADPLQYLRATNKIMTSSR